MFFGWTNPLSWAMLPLGSHVILNPFPNHSNNVLLQGTHAERGPSPHQPQPTSHSETLGATQSPESASLSPPPCKVESHTPPSLSQSEFLGIFKQHVFYLHSNHHPISRAPCPRSLSLIHLCLFQPGTRLSSPCPPSTLSPLPFHPAPLFPL